MTSRERVVRALEFRGPDRAPRELWALPWVSQFAAAQHAEVLKEFPSDFIGSWPLARSGRARGEPARNGVYLDDWGVPFVCGEDGVIGEVKAPPLAEAAALASFQPPWEIIRQANWGAVNAAQQKNLASSNPRFLKCGTSLRPFERMQFLRGSENLFVDMAYDSLEFRRLRDLVHEFFLAELAGWVATDCDGLQFMDDWGSQRGLLISPAMWRAMFKPLYREYCRMIRQAGKKVFFHSDGCIFEILQDLIEIGVDAVNSQLFCMDIEEIGRRFRGRLTFWGEIDRQRVLPFGSAEEVRRAVGRVRRALDDGQGGVIAQCEWGVGNPADNIRAVFQAWSDPIGHLPT